jgi:sigma-B regulation protein RsbU (phosphoserine phosphatase)
MRKPIFLKLALLIIPIVLVLDAIVLFLSYKTTYESNIESYQATIKNAAELATEIIVGYDLEDKDNAKECSDTLSSLCTTFDVTYIYVIKPDVKNRNETYMAIGFGPDADEEARKTRYHGVEVKGTLTDEEISVLDGKDDGVFVHEKNQFGETLTCYLPSKQHWNEKTLKMVDNETTLIVGAEINLSSVQQGFKRKYNTISLLTVLLTLLIVGAIGLILYFRVSRPLRRITSRMSGFVADRQNGFEKLNEKGTDEFAEMSRSFNKMADEIDTYIRDIETLTKKQHTQETELSISRTIQEGLLKPTFFRNGKVTINALMQAARNVGGDLYDYQVLEDGKVFIAIADVSGKGISAALFMSRGITLLHQYALLGHSPAKILEEYNNSLAETNPNGLFITTFVAIYDPETGDLTYANAGHNHPYILADRLIELDGALGMAAGVFSGEVYEQETVRLEPGNVVFLYTDGVNEAENENMDMFGDEAMEDVLKAHLNSDNNNLCGVMLQTVKEFSGDAVQSDDITMLMLRILGPKTHREITLPAEEARLPEANRLLEGEELSEDLRDILLIMLEELFVNVCSYAYGDQPGEVTLMMDAEDDGILLTVIDSGKPFDPTNDVINIREYDHENSIGGLGRYMTFELADEYSYEYKDGRNILKVKKRYDGSL